MALRLLQGSLLSALVLVLMAASAAPVLAQDKNNSDAIHAATDISKAEQTKKELIRAKLDRAFEDAATDLKNALILLGKSAKENRAEMGPLDSVMMNIRSENVVSGFNVDQVNKKLEEIFSLSSVGQKEVENAVGGGVKVNPYSGTALMADTYMWDRFEDMFCIPESATASPTCKEKAGKRTSNQNFIDFFISERTWTDNQVIDALAFARRFFVSGAERATFGLGTVDANNFIKIQGGITRANLRMAVLNDLAARRAPTSMSAQKVLGALLATLAPTGKISSPNYEAVCNSAKPSPLESYACSFTSKPATGGPRIISQAAIDKIIQYDYMLSPNFYNDIHSSGFSSETSIQRVEVFLKAQQLAQDYRALQLIKMKTATMAMNIMNTR